MEKASLKKLLSLGEIIFGLILALVIILSVFPLIPPFKNYYHSRTVLTGSMEPSIHTGSVVIDQWTPDRKLKIGDVVSYRHQSDQKVIYITHRIVKIDKTGLLWRFETKGDANPAPDFGLITQTSIEGKVIMTIPLVGYSIEFFKTPVGFILLIALPLLVFIGKQLFDLAKIRKKNLPTLILLLVAMFGILYPSPVRAFFAAPQIAVAGVTLQTAASFDPPAATLIVENKTVAENVTNGNFSAGLAGWTTAGDVTLAGNQVLIGDPSAVNGNYVWENILAQSFPAGAKTLSLNYNFFTSDSAPFDNPGFLIRLNSQQVFSRSASAGNSGLQQFIYNISHFNSPINLAVYAGNTGDTRNQSWAYVNNVTTNLAVASPSAGYSVSGATSEGPADCQYRLDGGGWQAGANFQIVPEGRRQLGYQCISRSGVPGSITTISAQTLAATPSAVFDLGITGTNSNSAFLVWDAPSAAGRRAAQYDLRYSLAPITADNFPAAAAVSLPGPKEPTDLETAEVLGLNPATTYYFALKTADQAGNWSAISNIVSATTQTGTTVNEGDIVINELMWMGTGAGSAGDDGYLELRNMTNRAIDLTGFKLLKYNGTDMGVNFFGKSIGPHALFLVTNYAPGSGSTRLKSSVTADLVDSGLTISNTNLEISLKAPGGTTIDTAGGGGVPTAGLYNSGSGRYYSMERTEVPGDGRNALSWYTCVDSASSGDFFTGPGDQRGTPGAVNRSNNEPVPGPAVKLTLSSDGKTLSYVITNVDSAATVSYLLTYDTDTAPQGVKGSGRSGTILLGTCSTGGTCVYNTGVKNFRFSATLAGPTGRTMNLEAGL